MKENKVLLALYGTLRSGGSLHESYLVHRSQCIGKGKVDGYAMMVCLDEWFPRAFHDADESVVVEVFSMDPETAKRISVMELSAGYRIEECSVSLDDGEKVKAMIFVCEGARKGCRKVPSGDWMP